MDLKLTRQEDGTFDVSFSDLTSVTMESSIIMSLFSDSRVDGKRGYWGDTGLGSALWTMPREKITATTLDTAKRFCEESLAWLIDEGHAEAITVDISRSGMSELSIIVTVDSTEYRYAVEV